MRYSPEQARARRQHRENPNPTERPEEGDPLHSAIQTSAVDPLMLRIRELEAEVKELREENASQQAELRDLYRIRQDPRIKQMEEALREAKSGLYEIERMGADVIARDGSATPFVYRVRAIATRAILAALSPSDTEERE